jgi:mannose-6-phosphate isomerase-like protein (cupin superfamily)
VITISSPAATSDVSATTGDAPRAVATVVRPGEGETVKAFGNEILFKLKTEQTGGVLSLGLATTAPGKGVPPHVHHHEEEMFLILEGQYRFLIDGQWTEDVGPGSVVFLPRGCQHTFEVVGDTPGKHWTLQTPSGFERYYKQAGELFATGGPPDFGRLAALNEQYGYSFVRG